MQKLSIHFLSLLTGQAVAFLGSSLTGFALGIWAFQQHGSTSIYSIIALVNILPIFVLSPIAGVIADKVKRKTIVILANIASLVVVFALWQLLEFGQLTVFLLILLVALNASFTAFVVPVVSASIPLMVPLDWLNRANGLIALTLALVQFLTPALAGFLFQDIGLITILMLDLISGSFALIILAFCTIPQPQSQPKMSEGKVFHFRFYVRSLASTWRYMKSLPGLSNLIVFYGFMVSFSTGIAILVQPMLLTLTDPSTMGLVLSIASSGLIIGSLLVIIIKQPQQHHFIILLVSILFGLGCLLVPIGQSALAVAIGGFFIMLCHPIFDANNRALIQRKINVEHLGRVIGLRNFLLGFMQTTVFIAIGPLSDYVFEPQMAEGKWLHHYFSPLWGQGEGRGIALMISFMGLLILLMALYHGVRKKIAQVDHLKDQVTSQPAAS